MKILKDGVMPDGTEIRIEEWHENYGFVPYASTIGTYPISKATHKGEFAPKEGDSYRFSFQFNSEKETIETFNKLVSGESSLSNIKENFNGKREYLNCI